MYGSRTGWMHAGAGLAGLCIVIAPAQAVAGPMRGAGDERGERGGLLPARAFEIVASVGTDPYGFGNPISTFSHVAVNNRGEWAAAGGVANAPFMEKWFIIGKDGVRVAPTQLLEWNGHLAQHGEFRELAMNNVGQVTYTTRTIGGEPPSQRYTIYRDDEYVASGGDPIEYSYPGEPPFEFGWIDFRHVWINDSGSVLGAARVPLGGAMGNNSAIVFDPPNESEGGVWDQRVAAAPGMVVHEDPDEVIQWAGTTGIHSGDYFGFNNAGQVAYTANVAAFDRNGQLKDVFDALYVDGREIVRDGDPGPIRGSVFDINSGGSDLSSPDRVRLNSSGDVLLVTRLTIPEGSLYCLIRNGTDLLVRIDELQMDYVGNVTPQRIEFTDQGDAIWTGAWTDSQGGANWGILLNSHPIVQTFETIIDGHLLTSMNTSEVSVSDDGRWLAFIGQLEDDTNWHVIVVSIPLPGTAAIVIVASGGALSKRRRG